MDERLQRPAVPDTSVTLFHSHPAAPVGRMDALRAFSERAVEQRVPWPIEAAQFELATVKERTGRPAVWTYRHLPSGAELHLDQQGRPFRFTPTPNGPGPGRFTSCDTRQAIFAARLHHVLMPVFPNQAADTNAPASPEPQPQDRTAPIRRGHLTLVHSVQGP